MEHSACFHAGLGICQTDFFTGAEHLIFQVEAACRAQQNFDTPTTPARPNPFALPPHWHCLPILKHHSRPASTSQRRSMGRRKPIARMSNLILGAPYARNIITTLALGVKPQFACCFWPFTGRLGGIRGPYVVWLTAGPVSRIVTL